MEISLPFTNMALLAVGLFLFVFIVRRMLSRIPRMPRLMLKLGAVLFILLPLIVVALGVAGAFLPGVFPELGPGPKILIGIAVSAVVQVGYKQGKQFMETQGPAIIKRFLARIFDHSAQ